MTKYLGLDIGSSFLKGAILDPHARSIDHIRRVACPDPIAGLPPRHFELEPAAVIEAVQRLIHEFSPWIDECAAVLVCGQMGGTILCGPNGEPRSNYISWRDQRATTPAGGADRPSFVEQLRTRLTTSTWNELGNELRAGSASTLLAWLVAHDRPPARDERPCSLADFVIARLGHAECRMEPTEAIGLIDVRSGQWHREALDQLVGRELAWPKLADWRQPIAEWDVLGRRLPCHAPLGDHQCALAGSGLAEDELSINISTGSQVSRLARSGAIGAAQTRAYFDGWLLRTVTHLPAGRSLEVLVDLLTELPRRCHLADFDPWPAINAAASESRDTELEVDLTFFAGPLGDQGAIRRITLENLQVGAVFRSAWRGMARNYQQCARWLSPDSGWSRLVYSGGLAHKLELLREFTNEGFGCPSRVCAASEDTMQGLLTLAMVLAGESPSVIEAGAELNPFASGSASG